MLKPGCQAQYKLRHDHLWPELRDLLKSSGVRSYSIFLDSETHALFSYMEVPENNKIDELPGQVIMQKWWDSMKDLMECNEDHSPKSWPLQEMFFLP